MQLKLSKITQEQWFSIVRHAVILGLSAVLASLLDAVTNNPTAFGKYALGLALLLKVLQKAFIKA